MSIGQIAEGFYNNATNKNEELFNQRMEICRKCKIVKIDNVFGEVCNSRLYLNPDTDEVSKLRQPGFFRGCGCVLKAKTRVAGAKCPAKKW